MEGVEKKEGPRKIPFVGGEPVTGTIVEMVYRPETAETLFAVYTGGNIRYEQVFPVSKYQTLVPYSPNNNLIRNRIVLFPSETVEYESEERLIKDIRAFIHRYVDVSPLFESITVYYILLSWVYEAFNELPYLRVRGDFGSGKTRFLLIAGAIMFRPIFASGASSISPIFRILDSFHGTLLIDEGDFRMSDEKAELVKILNNGNSRGFPVLRSEQSHTTKEFNPVAYSVFGPKIIATRGFFQDRALESRFITEDTGNGKLRSDIPINLPSVYEEEALVLRNKLLMFRFRNLHKPRELRNQIDRGVEPRLNQIFSPLLSMIADEDTKASLRHLANLYAKEIATDRETDIEAQVLGVIQELLTANAQARLAIGDITARFTEKFGHEYERRITEKWIGAIVRKKLKLKTHRVQGLFVIPHSEELRLKALFERYRITAPEGESDLVDLVDIV
ncbi:MAG: hypothetical protein HYS51_00415 [Candidatus Zambryskibacteria bacterium]|nr:hypothetical protein [Candidatus Zambryskibacteria bacterium]